MKINLGRAPRGKEVIETLGHPEIEITMKKAKINISLDMHVCCRSQGKW
jgi:hypothetical protein